MLMPPPTIDLRGVDSSHFNWVRRDHIGAHPFPVSTVLLMPLTFGTQSSASTTIEPTRMGMEAAMTNRTDRETATAPSGRAAIRTEPAQTSLSLSVRYVPPAPHVPLQRPIRERDETDPDRCAAELVQRGRLILDVSVADLEAAEAKFGAFHHTTWHFRNALSEAQRSWERLRVELGLPLLTRLSICPR